MNFMFLVKESNRLAVYYGIGNDVYREEFHSMDELKTKYDIDKIVEISIDDPRIVNIRSRFVARILKSDYLKNIPDPLDDMRVCKGLMEVLFNKPSLRIRGLRLIEDQNIDSRQATKETELRLQTALLKDILNNIDELKEKYRCLNVHIIYELLALKDDDLQLMEICKKMKFLKNKDPNDKEVLDNRDLIKIYDDLLNFKNDHTGGFNKIDTKYEQRIYFNCHNEEILIDFLVKYAKECIKNKISYDCKGIFDDNIYSNDTTILYSSNVDMKLRLSIIEDIMNKHPEWRNEFKPPVYGTAKIGTGFYGICHEGLKMNTYNDYFQNICIQTRNSLVADLLIKNGIIPPTHPNYNQLYKLATLEGIEPSELGINWMVIERMRITNLDSLIYPFINDPHIHKELLKTTCDEFKYKVKRLHALAQKIDPSLGISVAISKNMIDYYWKRKEVSENNFESQETSNVTRKVELKPVPEFEMYMQKEKSILERLNETLNEAKMNNDAEVFYIIDNLYSQLQNSNINYSETDITNRINSLIREYSNYRVVYGFPPVRNKSLITISNISKEISNLIRAN